jgi:hypothetical protein
MLTITISSEFPALLAYFSTQPNNPEWAEKTGDKKKIEKQPARVLKFEQSRGCQTEGKRGTVVEERFGWADTETVLHPY